MLVPRYRHKISMEASLQKRCEGLLKEIAANHGFRVHELQVAPDHVHIFLGIKPTQSVSEAIRLLKCNSARVLFEEFPELSKRFWSGHLWSDGKFYRSIGQVTAETMQHHTARSSHI